MDRQRMEMTNYGLLIHNHILKLRMLLNRHRHKRIDRRVRTVWVRDWIGRRSAVGFYAQLLDELRCEDTVSFKNFLRVDPTMFQEIVNRLTPRLQKKDTWYRKALPVGLKVAITLRYLATGDSYHSLMYLFRVPHNTISNLVVQVCEAIISEYAEDVINTPTEEAEWLAISQEFSDMWQFHHVLGALDGKHVAIKCPAGGGSKYYNYKGFHSIVLMGLVDANYKFKWVNVGAPGACSDAQIWNQSDLKNHIIDENMHIPKAEPLPNDDKDIPYFIVGDDAFALRSWLMKPFSRRNMTLEERVFNYRLSRSRRVVENAFGILANRFQCLLSTLKQEPNNVVSIILACVCLHNIMRIRYPGDQNILLDREDENHHLLPGAWRDETNLKDIDDVQDRNYPSKAAKQQRLYLKHYYSSPAGKVPWQERMVQ
ncbi:Hypothetical predicted protein [Mytilus galloprovincialis]|uniref:DDE Tnp4 domain-containing protein n=1 Tax=Mytilus galloprovincialis TaxID=29158 RepID=A0A8B6ECS4_MYTGA|nr:Hypothetical predicted protein [Mytilus galloprovincialis]